MQKNPLASKVALVTGGARRIGAAIVQTLHEAGMNLVVHYNASGEEADALCLALNQKRKHSALAVRAELQAPDSERALVDEAASVWGRLDVLVNNASRFYRTPMKEITDYAWDDLMNSNLKAPFFLAQAAASHLAEKKGCIVNIADTTVDRPIRDYAVYCISKGGVISMTKVLAKELGPDIRVNAVSPGSVMWPEGKNSLSDTEKEKIIKRTSLRRAGEPQDIAKAVLFLIRDADYVTGQILTVDGGRTL